MDHTIAARRLRNQAITGAGRRSPADVAAWFGAIQAQEYAPAKWGLALRMEADSRDTDIERAFDAGQILRTHLMRPTWHFVTPADIRWLLELTAPRVHLRMAPYNRQLELDAPTLTRAAAVCERALRDGRYLTRLELAERLAQSGISARGQRLAHIAMHAELERVICSGPRRGNQFTYALLEERARRGQRLSRDEALGELARRFFRSHGPATVRDFVWWSGLTTPDAKRGIEIIRARSEGSNGLTYWSVRDAAAGRARDGRVRLLPVYDEYLVAYRDRHAVPHWPPGGPALYGRVAALHHPVVIDGQVAGLWRTVRATSGVTVEVVTAASLGRAGQAALQEAAARYATCLGVPVSVTHRSESH